MGKPRAWPVIFSAPMIRALLVCRKSQTRRLPTSMWANVARHYADGDECWLWAREAWSQVGSFDPGYTVYRATYPKCLPCGVENVPARIEDAGYRWRSSMLMPRWASRLSLLVLKVRRERLQDISHDDAVAEGVGIFPHSMSAQKRFTELWSGLHTEPGTCWDDNPEVYVIRFSAHRQNIDDILRGKMVPAEPLPQPVRTID